MKLINNYITSISCYYLVYVQNFQVLHNKGSARSVKHFTSISANRRSTGTLVSSEALFGMQFCECWLCINASHVSLSDEKQKRQRRKAGGEKETQSKTGTEAERDRDKVRMRKKDKFGGKNLLDIIKGQKWNKSFEKNRWFIVHVRLSMFGCVWSCIKRKQRETERMRQRKEERDRGKE